ncbi:hypothetical protein I302_103278 [Kwoniella bestiolae CBS 10118]|uniref:Uncharacterized protein n=1 Tax=Kwoniella bestiolae CBS 10118 TaxID=1296100 RepID=A0A1B9G7Z9_9TREE|nr:hypothetical protein I302_01977 [Kwoniella bestiolae CBS 10118]OCF27142.1 hypothetical protein I302_01977 [Kwoniella bestiolae CBS 10118]
MTTPPNPQPQRVTRSMSNHPPSTAAPPPAANTAPGPPVQSRSTSLAHHEVNTNPFKVDFVIPYSISTEKSQGQDRAVAQQEIKQGYEALLRTLEGEEGLRISSRARPSNNKDKGQEEIWVFVGAEDGKITELVERERSLDQAHNLPPHSHPIPPSPSTRIRLLYNLLTAPAIQDGLGITPNQGKWKRVKSIMALHDEVADKEWVERWTTGGDWRIGLLKGLDGKEGQGLGEHQPPPVHLYFNFLTTYTLSLLPLSVISTLFYLLTPSDSYPPLYAFVLSIYSTAFVAIWRIKERKLAIKWGTRGCESVAVGRLRPEYVANLGLDKRENKEDAVDVVQAGNDIKRDIKVTASIPIIIACGVGLGVVLLGIFMLEAFVGQAYDGFGKEVVPLLPTVLFAVVVPQIVAAYGSLARSMVKWEDHPTPVGAEKSLTAKTFAMNAIVAYLGLFLSAYVYVPFGSFIMARVQHRLTKQETVSVSDTPEKAGLGPRTSGKQQKGIKAGRLKGQLFAYTVTNQVINAFLELGLPFIMRFVDDWRAGKTTIKETIQKRGNTDASEKIPQNDEEVEKRFLEKVERELALPDYSLFTDYAEMVTQFGYVTIWSIVWPLAPVFALVNNYVELRSDALKICKHVRRPVGDRVETIGSWLETLSIISWIGAITNSTLIYLFRPTSYNADQTPNPNLTPIPGSASLHHMIDQYNISHNLKTVLPLLIPLGLIALTASHGYIILRWIVDGLSERLLWRNSEEERLVQKLNANQRQANLSNDSPGKREKPRVWERDERMEGFWNGGVEGGREIGRVLKAE